MLWETTTELAILRSTIASVERDLKHRAPVRMSRLERSIASSDVFAFSKDSTKHVATFLAGCERDLSQWIEHYNSTCDQNEVQSERAIHISSTYDHEVVSMSIKNVLDFTRDLLSYLHLPQFDEGIFQTYIGIGRSIATTSFKHEATRNLGRIIGTHLEIFDASWKLSTGTSMEILWNHFRQSVAKDLQHLNTILEVEELANDFDMLAIRSKAPFAMLSDVREAIIYLYSNIISTDHSAVDKLSVRNPSCSQLG